MVNNIIFHKAIFTLIVLFLSFIGDFLVKKILSIYKRKVAIRTKTKEDEELIPLIQRIIGLFIWVMGLAFILVEFGVNVTGLFATAGAGSICTAMLLKDSITNVVAGVTLMFDRPFRVGDIVKIHTGDIGKIIKIGLRRTKILIEEDSKSAMRVLVIANASLSTSNVYNYTMATENANG